MPTTLIELVEIYKKIGCINLHLHTDASHLDGMNDLPSLIKRLKEIGHTACSITDHGVAHNLFSFYRKAIENDIKPVLGVEFYMSDARQLQAKADFLAVCEQLDDDFIYKGDKSHLVVLAKNFKGYQNLCKLVTLSNQQGVYTKPRIDFELLKKYHEGLIVIEGHVGTMVARSFERYADNNDLKDYDRAYKLNKWYKDVFGDDYYLEIQNHRLGIEKKVTPFVIEMAQKTDTKLVMTNDSHYTWRSDADIHRIHMSNGLNKSYEEFMNGDFEGFATCDEFYVKDNDEMLEMALDIGEVAVQALLNTHEVVAKCNVEIPYVEYDGDGHWKTKNYLFPNFPIPPMYASKEAYFEYLAKDGLKQRIENDEVDLDGFTIPDYEKRLEYEIGVINKMGFPTYFTILWDLLKFCRDEDIPVGKGRGSGAGSLVAYSLKITDVDPLEFGLIFERFLNPSRVSLPDIDMDFCYERIGEVIEYTKKKYGYDKVCKIGSFGTLKAKAVLKDVARVLEYDYNKINTLTKKITELDIKLEEILKEYSEVRELYENDEDFKRVFNTSLRLEGLQRHTSKHAAGIVISPFSLTDAIPLIGEDEGIASQYDMTELELVGFVKMDYLRLKTLTIIKNTTNAIEKHTGKKIDIDKIDFNDDRVFEKFRDGDTTGIFQFESAGMQSLLKQQGPRSILDLSAINALYRPGPLEAIDNDYGITMAQVYVNRAGGKMETKYMHPLLEKVQKDTYGVDINAPII